MGEDRFGRSPAGGDLRTDASSPRLYGRRRGRTLRPSRVALVEDLLPQLAVPDPLEGPIDPVALFPGKPRAIWLEIGFGTGENLAWQAAANPDIGLIGAEPFLTGVASGLAAIEAGDLQNIRIHAEDARPLMMALPEASIARVFVLQPDPWRKRRHWDRRLIGDEGLAAIARILVDGGELRTSSDDAGYQPWMLRHLRSNAHFEWLAQSADDWRVRPDDWPETRYAEKGRLAGRKLMYLQFRRKQRAS